MKKIAIILLVLVVVTACEEYFKPDVEDVDDVLVIEGMITDETKAHFVKLSMGTKSTNLLYLCEVDKYSVRIESDNNWPPKVLPINYFPELDSVESSLEIPDYWIY